ncbi:MAG: hypothetical protein Q4A96_02135 [Candidatus Saccharibacteria bacterium]|nr:hypothetical protein [Candidatus Saccharibacteria bacterium]
MSKNSKTKQGMASIYIVVFTTLLISIITLSFLRIMLSESGRTSRDTLSDSAYNSALAGVEDAKTVYSLYQKALAGETVGVPSDLKKTLEEAEDNDCDLVRRALGGNDAVKEDEYKIDDDITDQAYTCVTMSLEGNFEGLITKDEPVLVVPLRSKNSMKPSYYNAKDIAAVKIVWHNQNSNANSNDIPSNYDFNNNDKKLTSKAEGIFGKMGMQSDSSAVDLNALNVMLVQSRLGDTNPNYYAANGSETNRGYLTLVPYGDGTEAGVFEVSSQEMVDSADKTINQPTAVKCSNEKNVRCEVKIGIPDPIGGPDRDPENFFLVLSKVYADPDLDVTVEMLDASDNVINFWNVQPIVDATGRAGDLMRRVEARLGTKNGADLLPTAELSVNGNIEKNFYVTKNCIKGVEKCDDSGTN